MKILVTGNEGQIGTELTKLLSSHEVLGIDKKSGNNLNDSDVQEDIEKFAPEAVFHLAASFERIAEGPQFDKVNWEDNILATRSLLECMGKPKQIIFASSYLVYDPAIYMSGYPAALYESMPTKPRNLCGAAKLYAESEINFVANRIGATATHARIFRVYSNQSQCFINHFHEIKKLGGVVNVWNTHGSFDFIHARDVASALVSLFDANVPGVFNVGTGVARTVKDVIDLVGVGTQIAQDLTYTEHSYASIGKIRSLVGWEPKVLLEAGIKEMVCT